MLKSLILLFISIVLFVASVFLNSVNYWLGHACVTVAGILFIIFLFTVLGDSDNQT